MAHRAALIPVCSAVSQTPAYTSAYAARPQTRGKCITWCVCLHLAFAGTHCAYPLASDGQMLTKKLPTI